MCELKALTVLSVKNPKLFFLKSPVWYLRFVWFIRKKNVSIAVGKYLFSNLGKSFSLFAWLNPFAVFHTLTLWDVVRLFIKKSYSSKKSLFTKTHTIIFWWHKINLIWSNCCSSGITFRKRRNALKCIETIFGPFIFIQVNVEYFVQLQKYFGLSLFWNFRIT